jgi:hypothetical protein
MSLTPMVLMANATLYWIFMSYSIDVGKKTLYHNILFGVCMVAVGFKWSSFALGQNRQFWLGLTSEEGVGALADCL